MLSGWKQALIEPDSRLKKIEEKFEEKSEWREIKDAKQQN